MSNQNLWNLCINVSSILKLKINKTDKQNQLGTYLTVTGMRRLSSFMRWGFTVVKVAVEIRLLHKSRVNKEIFT